MHCLEVLINCLYYNPVITLRELQARQAVSSFFGTWFSNLAKMSRVHDKKLGIAALVEMTRHLATGRIQQEGQVNFGVEEVGACMKGLITYFAGLPKAIEGVLLH